MKPSQFNALAVSLLTDVFEAANDLSLLHLSVFLSIPEYGVVSYADLMKRLDMGSSSFGRAVAVLGGFDKNRNKPLCMVVLETDLNDRRTKTIALNDTGRAFRQQLFESAVKQAGICTG